MSHFAPGKVLVQFSVWAVVILVLVALVFRDELKERLDERFSD